MVPLLGCQIWPLELYTVARLEIIGEIGKDVTAEAVAAKLAGVPTDERLTVVLDSIGGSIYDGQRIADMLAQYPNREVEIIRAYSIASWIVLQFPRDARKVHIDAAEEFFMIHMPVLAPDRGDTYTADELKELATQLVHASDVLAQTYSQELGITKDEAMALMQAETYFKPEDQRKYQLMAVASAGIIEPQTETEMSAFAKLLDSLSNKIKALEIEVEPVEMEKEEDEMEAMKKQLAAMTAERDQLKAMCDDMEAKMKAAEGETTEALSEMEAKFVALEKKFMAKADKLVARADVLPDPGAAKGNEGGPLLKTVDTKIDWHRQMLAAKAKAVAGALVILFCLFCGVANAQVTQNQFPRWGTNTGTTANPAPSKYGSQIVFSLAAGVDTINITPNAQYTVVRCATGQRNATVALTDSVAIRFTLPANNTRGWWIGDQVIVTLLADGSARKVKYAGSLVAAPGTTITAGKYYSKVLVYNGSTWVSLSAGIVAP
jgi:ATP-dependent protease ClpP protease subunit